MDVLTTDCHSIKDLAKTDLKNDKKLKQDYVYSNYHKIASDVNRWIQTDVSYLQLKYNCIPTIVHTICFVFILKIFTAILLISTQLNQKHAILIRLQIHF